MRTVVVQLAVRVTPSCVTDAVISAVPGATPVTVPLLTVATASSELDQVTVKVSGTAVAVRLPVLPVRTVSADLFKLISGTVPEPLPSTKTMQFYSFSGASAPLN